MYGRTGLDRFKKAQTSEPFSVSGNSRNNSATQPTSSIPSNSKTASARPAHGSNPQNHYPNHQTALQKSVTADVTTTATVPSQHVTQVGGGQSTWQPPDWAIEPRPGVYYLDVVKDGEVLDKINLDRRRHIFGRQFHTCDYVLDHQSVSRQHAVVVPHKNGSVFVIDLGSAHGTFVANERLTKNSPVELEAGQSLRFAASTRTYVLRKNDAALFPPPTQPTDIDLPSPPDPADEEAVLFYNTYINRSFNGLKKPDVSNSPKSGASSGTKDDNEGSKRESKRLRRTRVAFKDQVGGELIEVVGFSDGADVETEPGPLGVKEGSLVGKYESLVQVTVIPKGKEHATLKEASGSRTGVTEKLQQMLNKVKGNSVKSSGIYDDLYGESLPVKVGSSWAYASVGPGGIEPSISKNGENSTGAEREKSGSNLGNNDDEDEDDLFG